MTKEELKNVIFSGVILDRYRRASIEQFIEETDDLTIDNFMEKYQEWVNSGKNKKAFDQVREEILDESDAKIKVGINSISNNNYTPSNDSDSLQRFKMDRVRCNSTGLNGIITDNGEEVLPCVFDYINIHLDGFVEARFKGMECNLMTVYREAAEKRLEKEESLDKKKVIILYGKTGALRFSDPLPAQLLSILKK